MDILIPITLNIISVIVIYLLDKHTRFNKIPYVLKQIIIGVLFGIISCIASRFGIEVMGTVANVRDAAPITAGLIFGSPSGIIAGVMGGTYRWFSVYWGAGMYTRVACSIATILAGVMVAALRKFMFDNKKPTWSYAIAITVLCEVMHMLLIFLTNIGDSVNAFELVKIATIPMIIGNVMAVGISFVAVSCLSKEWGKFKLRSEHIAEAFQRWLLICIIVAYGATGILSYALQNGMVKIETKKIFESAIESVHKDVREKSDARLLEITAAIKNEYESNPSVTLSEIASERGVTEINVISEEGIIIDSTAPAHVGFDMRDTKQSKEFLALLDDKIEHVQEFMPMGIDGSIMRKFAGVALLDGGFIQVGYNTNQFYESLDGFVIDVTKNRVVGSSGFIAVCDDKLHLVTDNGYNGEHISKIGIEPTLEMLRGESATALCRANVVNSETEFSEEYIYAFTFVEGYCIIAAMPEAEAMFMRDASVYNNAFMQVLIFAVLFLFIYILIKQIIINNLRKVNNTLAQITEGNLNVSVDVRATEEFASLSDDINSTVTTLKRYIAEAAARIDKELEYAKQIQLSALPTSVPNGEDYGISAQMIAAKEVGGDFYDFYEINDHTVAFLVADVSGKGIPAAMFMMTSKTIIKDLAESGIPVNEIFTKANEKLCESNESGMFVTAWMGILDTQTGKLQYSNAGHNPPLIKGESGRFEYLRSRPGFVLGGMEGIVYRVNELQLNPGDRIFLYTDGVSEATDTHNQLYGEERLAAFMNKKPNLEAGELLSSLKLNIDEFVGEAPQFDDITMLMLDYKIKGDGDEMTTKSFPAKTDALNDVLGFVEESLESFECSMKISMAVCVAIEEIFVNVANYAYGDGEGDVELSIGYNESSREVTFIMSDEGVEFDPLKKPDPDITLSADERSIGGLGIFITKKTMDSIDYEYKNGKNVLTMIKKI